MDSELMKKYSVSTPRYTSYPTVTNWDAKDFDSKRWEKSVRETFNETNFKNGISLHIHLPFCESLCTFCGCDTRITVNHAVEEKYIAALTNEWDMYLKIMGKKPRIKQIHLGGGTPSFFSNVNLKRLIQHILATADVCEDVDFSFKAHSHHTSEEHLKTLFELGFTKLSLAIQDFDTKVQTLLNRIQPFENVQKLVSNARSIGYTSINFDVIYGLPLQTQQTVNDTIEIINLLRPDCIAFYSYRHIPEVRPVQRAFNPADIPVGKDKRMLYETGLDIFSENGYTEIGMDQFALRSDALFKAAQQGKLYHNLMGYTISDTKLLIALGTSTISDSGKMYVQNAKKVEEYFEFINQNKLPVSIGHVLSKEDRIIRKHMVNIMCKFHTSWENADEQCDEVYLAMERLKELEKDKLVEITPFHLKVNLLARPFIRNICMAFDQKLWENIPQTQLFI